MPEKSEYIVDGTPEKGEKVEKHDNGENGEKKKITHFVYKIFIIAIIIFLCYMLYTKYSTEPFLGQTIKTGREMMISEGFNVIDEIKKLEIMQEGNFS